LGTCGAFYSKKNNTLLQHEVGKLLYASIEACVEQDKSEKLIVSSSRIEQEQTTLLLKAIMNVTVPSSQSLTTPFFLTNYLELHYAIIYDIKGFFGIIAVEKSALTKINFRIEDGREI